ncbi:MAG: acyltransferase, partial [Proteobacteria bacterium]|nr:acyltransferase [Pseudomonadota bacterium]
MSRQPLDALTGMRGVASLWVLVFHLRPWLGLVGAADRFAQAGYLAVDVFFVLSGFVLAYQYRGLGTRPRAWLAFWWRRVARIAPLHVAITLALVAVVVARGWWGQPEYTVRGLLAQLTFTQTWSAIDATSWNEPAWSVSAEWHAYLAF